MHYLLIYDLADDYLDRRAAFREAHLSLAWQTADRGEILLAGALADPSDQAYLLFQGDSPAAAKAFAKADPYVVNGLVKRWRVRQWNSVVGQGCANPVRP
ncbi:MAG TPA: YciI-like protein [Terracidiphilus sp.]|nr:YciI-like protein [Terracidiphilus sp.]